MELLRRVSNGTLEAREAFSKFMARRSISTTGVNQRQRRPRPNFRAFGDFRDVGVQFPLELSIIVAIGFERIQMEPPPRSAEVSLERCSRSLDVHWVPLRDRRSGRTGQVAGACTSFPRERHRRRLIPSA